MPVRRLPRCWLLMSLLALCSGGAPAAWSAAQDRQDAALPLEAAASEPPAVPSHGAPASHTVRCLAQGDGFLRARISGSIRAELAWGNAGTRCTGAPRPAGQGIRLSFSRPAAGSDDSGLEAAAAPEAAGNEPGRSGKDAIHPDDAALAPGHDLVLVFGITGLREGQSAHALPVNLTVIREGHGQFYSTQSDDKCLLDEVAQTPIIGLPRRSRRYRITARGFCTEPARAVRGAGAILMSRFDFAGQVDFETEDAADELHAAMPDG